MKILFITPYITASCHPAFMRNQTGFGYMVHDIAEYVAKTEEVDIYVPTAFTPEINVDGIKIIRRSKWQFLKNIRLRNIFDGVRFQNRYRQPLKAFLRSLYLFASIGQVESMMKLYDIVHIHGCSDLTNAAIKACHRQKIPFLVTLHGLNSFEQSIKLHSSLCRYERDFLKEAAYNKYPVSFISTGNKHTVEEEVGMKVDSFNVICNGCDVKKRAALVDVRSINDIPSNDFVFAFVGNISVNKNQIQVARAWNLLPSEIRNRSKVLFVGRYKEDDDLVKYINENKIQKNLILCGIQPKDNVSSYYQACDATILTSLTEGFGLSIIEGFVYGKPNITFADLPAIEDLYDENAMILVTERSDRALADAMLKMIQSSFDPNYISAFSKRFSFDDMANEYCRLYKRIVL